MKILPTISKGIVLMHEDGAHEMAPFQIFQLDNGMTIIRIGNNALHFDEDGKFDGSECKFPDGVVIDDNQQHAIVEAFEQQSANRGNAPLGHPYFAQGSRGWEREVASWESATGEPPNPNTMIYQNVRDPDDTSGTVH